MPSFVDVKNRPWGVTVSAWSVGEVRKLLGVDLARLHEGGFKPLADLLADPVRLIDVVYVLCREQCEAQKVSDEDFGRAMLGDVLYAARDAFAGALVEFTPDKRRREALSRMFDAAKRAEDRLLTKGAEALAGVNLDAAVDEALKKLEA